MYNSQYTTFDITETNMWQHYLQNCFECFLMAESMPHLIIRTLGHRMNHCTVSISLNHVLLHILMISVPYKQMTQNTTSREKC